MSTQAFVVSGEHFGMAIFDPNLRYRFEIENTGDAKPDLFIDVTYSPGLGRLTTQTATIKLPNGATFTAPTTLTTQEIQPTPAPAPVITTDPATGASFYAGAADDPFFLDDTGANLFVASSLKNPGSPDKSLLGKRGRDTYAGFNTMITAISVPAEMLRGNSNLIGVNAVTQRRHAAMGYRKGKWMPVDQEGNLLIKDRNGNMSGPHGKWVTVVRDGNPLVNNLLLPSTVYF